VNPADCFDLKTARVAGGRMLVQVYFCAANVGVGVGVGEAFAGVDDGECEVVWGCDGVAEQPTSAVIVVNASRTRAVRSAVEGPAMVPRIGQ
jgi:hypothetical protein